jgi:hypothetical protein
VQICTGNYKKQYLKKIQAFRSAFNGFWCRPTAVVHGKIILGILFLGGGG